MNENLRSWRFDTKTVHLLGERTGDTSFVPPIYQTSTFQLKSAKEGADYAISLHPVRFYTRWGNPTTHILENAVAELEEGERALAASSGMAAISTAILTAVKKGDRIVAQKTLYSATEQLFTEILPNFGVSCDLVDARDPEKVKKALSKPARLLYLETPANPTLDVVDIKACAEIASEKGALVFVDNTYATPYNQNPLKLGASVILHSATKYLSGHFDVTGGVIVASRTFIEKAWKTLKIFGPSLSPFDSWLIIRGLKTLALRMERHNHNAMKLAEFLEAHHLVENVFYPGLPKNSKHSVAKKQMRGFGGMLSFELKGGYKAARKFVESVKLARLAVSLGGVETIVEHPASMTHGMLSEASRRKAGISDALIRVSVGIEDVRDLLDDFDRALHQG